MKKKSNQPKNVEKQLEDLDVIRLMSITVKAVVVRKDEKVLLLKRSKEELTNKGKWDLPGGSLEKKDTINEALFREVREETGLDIEIGSILRVVEFEKEHLAFKQERRGLRFIVFAKSEKVKLSEEHDEYEWLEIDEAIEKLSEKDGFEKEKKETLKEAKKYLKMKSSTELWKRAVADFENFKKRSEKSNVEFRKFCLENFVVELLPVIDNFEMALKHVPQEQADDGWVTGVLHIKDQLLGILESNGITEIAIKKGDEIDEIKHHVLSGQAKKGNGRVEKVLKKGYMIGEKVIRPASVEAK